MSFLLVWLLLLVCVIIGGDSLVLAEHYPAERVLSSADAQAAEDPDVDQQSRGVFEQ